MPGHLAHPSGQVGQRQTVQQEEYYCHVHNKDGLVGIAFVDADYPVRAGFCVVSKVGADAASHAGAPGTAGGARHAGAPSLGKRRPKLCSAHPAGF